GHPPDAGLRGRRHAVAHGYRVSPNVTKQLRTLPKTATWPPLPSSRFAVRGSPSLHNGCTTSASPGLLQGLFAVRASQLRRSTGDARRLRARVGRVRRARGSPTLSLAPPRPAGW